MNTQVNSDILFSLPAGIPRLEEVAQPQGLMVRLLYLGSKFFFGKIVTPVKVIYARAPHLAGPSQAIRKSISKLVLDSEIRILVQILTAMRNGCAFCADLALAEGVKKKIGREKFQALGIWLSDGNKQLQSEQFTEKQMVALELADLIASHSVTDEAFANAGRFFNERELIEIAWVVSVESYYNALNGALGIGSDTLRQWFQNKRR